MDTIVYRGEKIKLSCKYSTYEEYKNDPNNIDPSEDARVAALISNAKMRESYPDIQQLFRDSAELVFPGYGSGPLTNDRDMKKANLVGVSVEIPRTEKNRYFVFRKGDNAYVLIDDFVATEPLLYWVREEDGFLVFSDFYGKTNIRRSVKKQDRK